MSSGDSPLVCNLFRRSQNTARGNGCFAQAVEDILPEVDGVANAELVLRHWPNPPPGPAQNHADVEQKGKKVASRRARRQLQGGAPHTAIVGAAERYSCNVDRPVRA